MLTADDLEREALDAIEARRRELAAPGWRLLERLGLLEQVMITDDSTGQPRKLTDEEMFLIRRKPTS